jgi:hypothetical protein
VRSAISLLLLTAACSVELPPESAPSFREIVAPVTDDPASPPPPSPVSNDDGCTGASSETPGERICRRWRCEAPSVVAPASWDGSGPSCSPGQLDRNAAARALRRVNLHRFLAGLDPLVEEDRWIEAGQACAVLAHANRKLSHHPEPDWACWSELGASTSAMSLIANRSAEAAIGAYFEDPGNETTMSHRRWLLSPSLERVAFGSTDRYSCVVLDGPNRTQPSSAPRPTWAAWPPPGLVPIRVFDSEHLDTAGWTVQSDTESLTDATVSVSADGRALPVRSMELAPSYGSRSAIRFVPDGWVTTAGVKYTVRVVHRAEPDTVFTVEPIDC